MTTNKVDVLLSKSQHFISLGNLGVNFDNYGVFIDDESIELSVNEFEALRVMITNPDFVLPYSTFTRQLWRADTKREFRNLNVLVHRLRQKLAGSSPFEIKTVRGRGYGLIRRSGLSQRVEGLVGVEPLGT